MSVNKPLTEEEVKQPILTFWKMQEEKADLVDLMEVTAPDLEIIMGEVVLNHVDHMRYVEGFEPPEGKQWVDPHIGHEV